MKVQYSLVFNRKKILRKNGTAVIQVRAYLNGAYKYISAKIYVTPAQWDIRKEVIKNHPNKHKLNEQLRLQIEEMEVFELNTTTKQNGIFHLSQLENYRLPSAYNSFTHFVEMELQKEDVKESTRNTYVTTLSRLKAFRPVIYFEDLTYNMVREFDHFLKQFNNSLNTRAKNHKNVKKFVNLAIKLDLLDINSNPYKRFQVKKERTERTFLNKAEVERIEAIELGEFEQHLRPIIDLFLLSCYTGLRYSDVSRMAKDKIIETDRGYKIDMVSKKNDKDILLPLYKLFPSDSRLTKPEQIIKNHFDQHQRKYTNRPFYDDIHFFKDLTEPYVNRQLKIIAAKAGIKKNLTTHVGRHTFGTHMVQLVDVTIVQKLMQHSKLKETMIYVHLSNNIIEKALEKVNWNI